VNIYIPNVTSVRTATQSKAQLDHSQFTDSKIKWVLLQSTTNKMQCFLDLFISINCSTCFRRFLHPSSGAHTASGIVKL